MDKRDISRLNLKFGKFVDPLLLLFTLAIILTSIISVKNLTPRTFAGKEMPDVLGVEDRLEIGEINLIEGDHNYISSEKLEKTAENQFKYTSLIKKRDAGTISKPIILIKNTEILKAKINYSNATTSKISLVDEGNNTSYIIKENNNLYTPEIPLNENSGEIYLMIEDTKSVFFNQYIEIDFFLNL